VLERERTRADRTGRALSMVLLGHAGQSRRRPDAEAIVEVLQGRARITDEIGVFDRYTAFAVLPDTPIEGARRYAQVVSRQLKERQIDASFALYQYVPPSDESDDDQNASGFGAAESLTAQSEPLIELSHALQAENAVTPEMPAVLSGTVDPVHALEPMMARRLPWWKRTTDLVVAGSALAVVWPLLVVIGVAVKLDSPGPIIFKQTRAGLGGRTFKIWKFRTMRQDAESLRHTLLDINEQDGPAFKVRRDPRITRVGLLLRKTSLDELPQLLNILRGEMTLVGPRPLPMMESDACEAWQKRRLDVTPGLTCIWQVWGRSTVSFNEWVRMDLRYQRRRTLLHDLKILVHTVPAVLRQRGAC
jgi:lipopolysaccharide/colanic/teichoic acid biosynthesis glycosyltransferase